jgi:hypothetical protein
MTREYSSISVETTLNSGINTTATSIVLPSIAAATALLGGVTLAPGNVDIFTVALDHDTVNEEIVYVTGVSGDTLTVSRGQAGTGTPGVSGIAHSAGASVKHVMTSDDLNYFNTAIQPDILTTKGDIYAASASGVVGRVGVGTNGQVLTADSSQNRGLAWATVSSTPRIGQVVQTTGSSSFTTSSASYVDVTSVTASITPTLATSKVLVSISFDAQFNGVWQNPNIAAANFQIVRTSTGIMESNPWVTWGLSGSNEINIRQRSCLVYLDSPATTSATTYKLQCKVAQNAAACGMPTNTWSIILQEVLV